MLYNELCDAVMSALKNAANSINVSSDSIVEGGREAQAPSVNVFLDPAVDIDANSHPSNSPGFLDISIRIVCISGSKKNDSIARREAFSLCFNASKVLFGLGYINKLSDIGFADTNADAAVCTADFVSKIEFIV